MNFKEECNLILGELGYSLHSSSQEGKYLTYSNVENEFSPSIICSEDITGKKKMKIKDSMHYKYFLTLASGELQFNHPDLKRYIKIFEHYSQLAKLYPPF